MVLAPFKFVRPPDAVEMWTSFLGSFGYEAYRKKISNLGIDVYFGLNLSMKRISFCHYELYSDLKVPHSNQDRCSLIQTY